MLRIVVTICVASHLVTALPQQRPLAQAAPTNNNPSASTLGQFSPAYTQQLAFGGAPQQQQQSQSAAANSQIRQRGPGQYQSPQPIIISHSPQQTASPATPSAFASFPGAQFGGAGRQILTLRSPSNSQSNDEDEYEYEDDDEPTIQSRPSPAQRIQPVTRSPVRVQSPTPSSRFSSQPVQQQQQRQRQPIPQQVFQSAPQQQQLQQRGQQQQQQIAQQQRQAQASPNAFSFDGKRSRLTTPPPVQTVNRYMKQNDDGSMTWGYENEDGTFKEETLGADCVVRGKYGYIDPDGNKREYEYQTGNPCDPNKKDQEEEAEEEDLPDGPSRPQQLAGILNARPRPLQRRPQGGQIQQQYQGQPQYQLSK